VGWDKGQVCRDKVNYVCSEERKGGTQLREIKETRAPARRARRSPNRRLWAFPAKENEPVWRIGRLEHSKAGKNKKGIWGGTKKKRVPGVCSGKTVWAATPCV